MRWRGIIITTGLAITALIAFGFLLATPAWARYGTLALLTAGLGAVGAPEGKRLLDTAVVRTGVAPLTSDEVVRALASLRIVGIDRVIRAGDTGSTWFPAPITRENGTGWRADVELPRGVPASEVVDSARSWPPRWPGRSGVCGRRSTPRFTRTPHHQAARRQPARASP